MHEKHAIAIQACGQQELWFGRDEQTQKTLKVPGASIKRENDFFRGAIEAEVSSVVRLKLHAEALAEPHYSEAEVPRVAYDGEGLASVLQFVHGRREGVLEAIETDLAAIIPNARRIRTIPARVKRMETQILSLDGQDREIEQMRERTGHRFEVEWNGLGWIPADQLSEGTLLVLGLLTVLHHNAPRIVLLDDIDKALHPVAQKKLVGLLKQILQRNPNLQIIATSHSPFVLDELDLREVVVLGDGGERGTLVRRLDEHATAEKRGAYLRAGEFWSLIGEGWVAEGGA